MDSLKKAMGSAGSDEDEGDASGLLKVKEKSKEQTEREEADYIEWFKGQKADIGDQEIKKNMVRVVGEGLFSLTSRLT